MERNMVAGANAAKVLLDNAEAALAAAQAATDSDRLYAAKEAVIKAKEQWDGMLKAVAYAATYAATDSILRSYFISENGLLRYAQDNLR